MPGIEEVLAYARVMQSRAYAPYSGFKVGAVLVTEKGALHGGCNVENASFGLTLCAERNALSTAVALGDTAFRRLVLVTDGQNVVPPCGACREVLAEFSPELVITAAAGEEREEWSLRDLLPRPFRLEIFGG